MQTSFESHICGKNVLFWYDFHRSYSLGLYQRFISTCAGNCLVPRIAGNNSMLDRWFATPEYVNYSITASLHLVRNLPKWSVMTVFVWPVMQTYFMFLKHKNRSRKTCSENMDILEHHKCADMSLALRVWHNIRMYDNMYHRILPIGNDRIGWFQWGTYIN